MKCFNVDLILILPWFIIVCVLIILIVIYKHSYSLTLIDALDTLAIMGNHTEFRRVAELVIDKMNFDLDINASVFETNIRSKCDLVIDSVCCTNIKSMEDSHWMYSTLIYLKEIIEICNNKDAKEIKMQYTCTLRPAPPFFVVLGGLLSAHLFTKRAGMEVEAGWPCSGPLLRLAEDVARRLLPGNLQVTSSCSHWYRNCCLGVWIGN